MIWVRKLAACVAAVGLAVAPVAGWAAPSELVMNKEGYWGVEVGDSACAASMKVEDGSLFLIRAIEGQATFAVFKEKPIRAGREGQVQTEAYGFDFEPSFTEDRTGLYYEGDLDSRALAALRLAKEVRVLLDGRLVSAVVFEGTGFSDALDGAIACSQGKEGWWGKGVAAADPAAAGAETGGRPRLAFNEEGAWGLEATDRPSVCMAYGLAGEHVSVIMVGALGQIGLAVNSEEDLPQGRKGVVETDAFSFAFKPQYDGARYFMADEPFDSQAIFALRRAKSLRVSVDGRTAAAMNLEGTGFAGLLEALVACSKGEKGWWGDGAKQE